MKLNVLKFNAIYSVINVCTTPWVQNTSLLSWAATTTATLCAWFANKVDAENILIKAFNEGKIGIANSIYANSEELRDAFKVSHTTAYSAATSNIQQKILALVNTSINNLKKPSNINFAEIKIIRDKIDFLLVNLPAADQYQFLDQVVMPNLTNICIMNKQPLPASINWLSGLATKHLTKNIQLLDRISEGFINTLVAIAENHMAELQDIFIQINKADSPLSKTIFIQLGNSLSSKNRQLLNEMYKDLNLDQPSQYPSQQPSQYPDFGKGNSSRPSRRPDAEGRAI